MAHGACVDIRGTTELHKKYHLLTKSEQIMYSLTRAITCEQAYDHIFITVLTRW